MKQITAIQRNGKEELEIFCYKVLTLKEAIIVLFEDELRLDKKKICKIQGSHQKLFRRSIIDTKRGDETESYKILKSIKGRKRDWKGTTKNSMNRKKTVTNKVAIKYDYINNQFKCKQSKYIYKWQTVRMG